ncbi:MAG: sensor histidine kinase, partial [Candidatus Aerophobetes bacterium]|nr:sensor histidine kinase [Candidatus Aerophobetes bacterium]
SLLNLEAGYIKDKQALKRFGECQSRIRTMALIHEKLSESRDLARIDFAEYTQSLVADLCHSYQVNPEAVKLKVNIGNVSLGIDTAIPCGLIINELVSNSLKHAFPKNREGEIRVDFRSDNHKFTLIVSDNGIGLPKDLDFQNIETLGLQLVCTLADQIGGSIELTRSGGTEFKITFRKPKYKERN